MKYTIQIYCTSPDNSSRFALGTTGQRTLFTIGLNPSTADDKKPDMTITKVMGFADKNGYDSFMMFNLYPQRTSYPDFLHTTRDETLHQENLSHIIELLEGYDEIDFFVARGSTIKVRAFLIQCLEDIIAVSKNKQATRKIIGLTKEGHPRHPSRAPYNALVDFNIQEYLTTIKNI